jgi:hypothetical protein
MTQQNTDYNSPWKAFIELYFRDFLAFFFPHIETDIDWSKPIRYHKRTHGKRRRQDRGEASDLAEYALLPQKFSTQDDHKQAMMPNAQNAINPAT